jgi:deazaflavin-dependent oxidoreductase (nitroreductase family)
MGNTKLISTPPHGILRLGLRLPIWLYRIHLGWLLGNRFLLLNHTGRKSGKAYQTVIEVVKHDRQSNSFFVASGWGNKSDWYQNIQKNPDVIICSGRQTLPVHAENIPLTEAVNILNEYTKRYPIAFKELTALFLGERMQPGMEASQRLAEKMSMVVFRLRQ